MIEALIEQTRFNDSARVACPACSSERKKSTQKDMRLTRKADGAVVYHCHHCGFQGSVQPEQPRNKEFKLSAVPNPVVTQTKLSVEHYNYLKTRGISKDTADKMQLFASQKFFSKLGRNADCIGFPYYRKGALVSVKYRSFPD